VDSLTKTIPVTGRMESALAKYSFACICIGKFEKKEVDASLSFAWVAKTLCIA